MLKIKITKEQYEKIILFETKNKSQILSEGFRDEVLGISKLMGINLTGLNDEIATKALNDQKVLSNIKKRLENESDLDELIKALEEKGLKNPKENLSNNVNKIIKNFNKLNPKEKIGIKTLIILNQK